MDPNCMLDSLPELLKQDNKQALKSLHGMVKLVSSDPKLMKDLSQELQKITRWGFREQRAMPI
jgi:hypothetical protein